MTDGIRTWDGEKWVRPIEERLTEYRDMLLGLADQLEAVLAATEKSISAEDSVSLRDGIRLYRIIAGEDLTKILSGEELSSFVVTGEMPT